MIYLIAGCPLSGKTTLARELSHHTKIPCISTDDLSILFSYYTGYSLFGGGNYYQYYESSPSEKIQQDHLSYQTEIGKMLIHFLSSKIAQEEDLIMEGFALSPHVINELPRDQTQLICLVMEEPLLRQRYCAVNNFSRKKEDRALFDQKYLEKLLWINRSNLEECELLNLPYLTVRSDTSMLFPACDLFGL